MVFALLDYEEESGKVLKPRKPSAMKSRLQPSQQGNFLLPELLSQLDPRQGLYKLTERIDEGIFDSDVDKEFADVMRWCVRSKRSGVPDLVLRTHHIGDPPYSVIPCLSKNLGLFWSFRVLLLQQGSGFRVAMIYLRDEVRRGNFGDLEMCRFPAIFRDQNGATHGNHDSRFQFCNHITPVV